MVLLIFLVIAVLAIPSFKPDGVAVAYVAPDSQFFETLQPGSMINSINGVTITTLDEYAAEFSKLKIGENVTLDIEGIQYKTPVEPNPRNQEMGYIGINVMTTKSTKLEQGLDLQGGARVVLRPVPANESAIVDDELIDTTTSVLMARMNAYGLKNVVIRKIQDVNGLTYVEVEMAGEGSENVVDIVKSVGLFELKVLNETIITGDSIVPPIGEPQRDSRSGLWQIAFAINNDGARTLRESYVEMAPQTPTVCTTDEDCEPSYACSRGAAAGSCLPKIEMFLDDALQYSAPPAQALFETWKYGEESKNLLVQTNKFEDAQKVKIVLEAGRLPKDVKELRVFSQDYVDSKLGAGFVRGAIYAGLAAIIAVFLVVLIRYRKMKVVLPIIFVDVAELVIIIGFAAMIKWSIDLPAIAGMIAVLGTAVDQQIVITDQILSGEYEQSYNLKKSVKTAFKIVIIAASTTIAAMIPLAYPGFTGLYALRGFAIVTILGVLIGLLITRPAFARMIEILLGE